MRFVKPLDDKYYMLFQNFKALLFLKKEVVSGGAGSAVLEFAAQQDIHLPVQLQGIPDLLFPIGNTVITTKIRLDILLGFEKN